MIQKDIKRYLQIELARDIGKRLKQTPIELTRKILARRHASSIQVDISRFLTTNIERKRQTQASWILD